MKASRYERDRRRGEGNLNMTSNERLTVYRAGMRADPFQRNIKPTEHPKKTQSVHILTVTHLPEVEKTGKRTT